MPEIFICGWWQWFLAVSQGFPAAVCLPCSSWSVCLELYNITGDAELKWSLKYLYLVSFVLSLTWQFLAVGLGQVCKTGLSFLLSGFWIVLSDKVRHRSECYTTWLSSLGTPDNCQCLHFLSVALQSCHSRCQIALTVNFILSYWFFSSKTGSYCIYLFTSASVKVLF